MLLLSLALAAEPGAPAAAPGRGLSITSADGDFALGVRARFQLRESVGASAPADDGSRDWTMQSQLYTTRVWFQGHIFSPETRYVLQLAVGPRDFRDGAISPVYDAYLDLSQVRDASVRVGQFFVPFDRLRTIREFALQMPDRPKVVGELTLDRDIGVMLYADHLGGDTSPVAYRLGVFGGSGIHQTNAHPPGGLAVARIELRPLGDIDDDCEGDLERREKPGLAIGLGGAANLNTTRARSTTSSVYDGATATTLHGAADLVFKWRGFAAETELVARQATEDTLVSVDEAGATVTAYTRSGWGFVAQPSLMLTDRTEISARYGRLGAAADTDPAYVAEVAARPNEAGAGVSVYLNGHRFKVQSGLSALFSDDAPEAAEILGHVLVDAMF